MGTPSHLSPMPSTQKPKKGIALNHFLVNIYKNKKVIGKRNPIEHQIQSGVAYNNYNT